MDFFGRYETVWKKIGIIGGVCLGMKYLVPPVIPFLLAGLAAWWARPLILRMERRLRLRPAVSAGLILLAVLGLLGVFVFFLGSRICRGLEQLLAGEGLQGILEELLEGGSRMMEELTGIGRVQTEQFLRTQVQRLAERAAESVSLKSWAELAGRTGTFAAAVLITCIAFVLWSGDFEKIREKTERSVLWSRCLTVLQGIVRAVGTYLRAQCILIALITGVCTCGFYLAGHGHALLWGILTGLLDALPVLGTGLVLIPWIVLSAIRRKFRAALFLLAAYGLCVVIREVLEPRLLGRRMGLFPILVLMSIYAGVWLYGAGGLILGPLSLLIIREFWRNIGNIP